MSFFECKKCYFNRIIAEDNDEEGFCALCKKLAERSHFSPMVSFLRGCLALNLFERIAVNYFVFRMCEIMFST